MPQSWKNWAHLPTDIVGIIIRKLAIPDYLRFRAVCTSWNLVCGDASHGPRVDPWLMLPTNPMDGAKFFSVPERNNQIIFLPSTVTLIASLWAPVGTQIASLWAPVGSSRGWLIYHNASYGSMQLLNPITGAQLRLPSTSLRSKDFSRAALIDVNERGCTVVLIYSRRNGYAVTRTEYKPGWSSVESQHGLVDVMKHNGQLYTIDVHGTVEVWAEPRRVWRDEEFPHMHYDDDGHRPVLYNLLHHPKVIDRLVETPAGDLMRVKVQQPNMFSVCVLDKGNFTWVKVDNIGKMAVFASYTSTVCFPVAGHPSLRANCVYFLDRYKKLCTFNLEHKTKEVVEDLETALDGQWQEAHLWFIPSLS